MKKIVLSARMKSIVGGVVVILLCSAVGYAVSVPYSFTADTAAKAEEVNDNFTALKDAVDALETKVATLESSTLKSATGKLGYAHVIYEGSDESVEVVFSYNSSGGDVTVSRDDVGTYEVEFEGLFGSSDANIPVFVNSDRGLARPAYCGAFSERDGSKLTFKIQCQGADPLVGLDSSFDILVLQ